MSAPPANAAARNILSLSPTPKRAVPTTSHSALADSVTQFALGASDHTDLADQLLGTVVTPMLPGTDYLPAEYLS